uniref:Uncharacterized protein n=1 Tax=Moniliophthora roreri TaxID=221103 RepID=A0A0W0FFJ6_MONRR
MAQWLELLQAAKPIAQAGFWQWFILFVYSLQ